MACDAHGGGPAFKKMDMHFTLMWKWKEGKITSPCIWKAKGFLGVIKRKKEITWQPRNMTISEPLRQEHREWHQQYCNNMIVIRYMNMMKHLTTSSKSFLSTLFYFIFSESKHHLYFPPDFFVKCDKKITMPDTWDIWSIKLQEIFSSFKLQLQNHTL